MTTEPGSRAARIFFVLLGGPLTVLLIAFGAFAITGTLARQSESTALAFTGTIDRIEINVNHGSVTLRAGDPNRVTGERVLTRGLQSPTVSERVDDRTLVIEASCFPVGNTWCDVSYVLDIPSAVDVTVESAIGNVRLSNLTGAADLRSATGAITVERTTGPLHLESGAGSIRATDLASESVWAATGAGSVDLAFESAPRLVEATSGAGSVDVELPRDDAAYRIEAPPDEDGPLRIAVATDPASDRVLRLESGAGSVSAHYPEA